MKELKTKGIKKATRIDLETGRKEQDTFYNEEGKRTGVNLYFYSNKGLVETETKKEIDILDPNVNYDDTLDAVMYLDDFVLTRGYHNKLLFIKQISDDTVIGETSEYSFRLFRSKRKNYKVLTIITQDNSSDPIGTVDYMVHYYRGTKEDPFDTLTKQQDYIGQRLVNQALYNQVGDITVKTEFDYLFKNQDVHTTWFFDKYGNTIFRINRGGKEFNYTYEYEYYTE